MQHGHALPAVLAGGAGQFGLHAAQREDRQGSAVDQRSKTRPAQWRPLQVTGGDRDCDSAAGVVRRVRKDRPVAPAIQDIAVTENPALHDLSGPGGLS